MASSSTAEHFCEHRPAGPPAGAAAHNEDEWPTVDVLIPTYNEEKEILEVTLLAALAIDYPSDKLNVYICDDGGTDQRCNQAIRSKPRKPASAGASSRNSARPRARITAPPRPQRSRQGGQPEQRDGAEFGRTRRHLRCGSYPDRRFSEEHGGLVPEGSEDVPLQTPHFFTNPDPIEKNLKTWRVMPSENEMFYKVIQKGLDFWNSAFSALCGGGDAPRLLAKSRRHRRRNNHRRRETALTLHSLV